MSNRTTPPSSLFHGRFDPCACEQVCGDSDPDGPGVCKGLRQPRREPLIEVVVVHKDDLDAWRAKNG